MWSGFYGSGRSRPWATHRHHHSRHTGPAAGLFTFPNPVNEVSARLVAAGVVVMCVLTIALDWQWATVVIAYGVRGPWC